MSNDSPKKERRIRFRLPPAESQVVLALGAAVLGLSIVQFGTFSLLHLILVVVFFAIGILGRRAWAIYLLLAIVIVLIYFVGASIFKSKNANLRLSDFQSALVLIAFSAACFRYLESSRFLKTFYPDIELGSESKSKFGFEFPSLFGGRWWAIPMSIFLASVLLSVFPFEKQMLPELEILPRASRVIFLTLFLFFGWFVCRAVVGTIIRWRMDVSQADIHCRSLIAKELWSETYPIEKRRAKMRSQE